jgi:hypothetical protein
MEFNRGKLPLILAFAGLGALTVGIWVRDRQQMDALDAERARTTANLNQALNQAKGQIQDLTNRLDALKDTRPQPAPPAVASASVASANRVTAPARRKPSAFTDPRVDRLRGQLADTQKELAQTRQEVASTREDLNHAQEGLDGKINSTRDDLNGSIAKTHEELVALAKRGERNLYEFHLNKSKQFERVGPLSISLRSTNEKHKTYDVMMVVDDNELGKKHVNLYEPVWITLSDRPQPVELVVNRVGKNEIAGYVSEPKYKKSELASGAEQVVKAPQQLVIR